MADAIGRPLAFATEERRAVHSWCRISSAGTPVVLEALQIINPMCSDLSNTEDLVSFLKELSKEGHKATVLQSKDVYGYRSCNARPLTADMLKSSVKAQRPLSKKKRRKTLGKKGAKQHPSWSTAARSNPRIQGICPTEYLLEYRAMAYRPPVRTVEVSPVKQCLRLTNIEGLSGFHTARLQIHTDWESSSEVPPAAAHSSQRQLHHPPSLSGIPSQPLQNGGMPTTAVALLSQRTVSCPIRLDGALIGDSAPVMYSNGRVSTETNTELTSNGWRGNGAHRLRRYPKEEEKSPQKSLRLNGQRHSWKEKNSLRWKVIKVDDSLPLAEAQMKAQKILQVNLSPVIQIQPFVFRDLRHHQYQ